MINVNKVFEEMEKLIGCEFDENEIIYCFEDTEENIIVSKVEGYTSNFDGHGVCQLWNAYEDKVGSEIFSIWVDDENIIVDLG